MNSLILTHSRCKVNKKLPKNVTSKALPAIIVILCTTVQAGQGTPAAKRENEICSMLILAAPGCGFRAWALAGIPVQRIDEPGTRAMLKAAHEAGINYIDTARAYTVSEEWIGQALEELDLRDEFILATKCRALTKAEMEAELAASLKNLRTDHIDLYQFHNPSPENLDKILAPGGAMEALLEAKAKGVVGHIGITAHLSQTFEKALKVDEIETIMFPYNIVEQQGKELIDRCAEKGKAFIDMKPLAGGAIEDGRLALRYVLSNPAVTVSIPGMAAPEELEQNVAGSANTAPLTPEEKAACQKVRDTLGTQFCRRCNYCAPCTVGIQIPSCFLFHGYLERYGLAGWAHERYDTLTVKAGACIGCGKCETRCPYNLPIRDMLKKVAQDFGE